MNVRSSISEWSKKWVGFTGAILQEDLNNFTMGFDVHFPVFIDESEKRQFISWTNGHLAGKDYLISADKRSMKGIVHRNKETGDVKFELQIEYTNLNALDDTELVLESIRQL